MLTSVELPMVMLCATIVLHERVSLIQTVGAVTILLGITLSSIEETKKTTNPMPINPS
jgi:drug/metabolite transporter (DMT)-like permease